MNERNSSNVDNEPNPETTSDAARETIEIETKLLRGLAWELMADMPASHVQSFHQEIGRDDVRYRKLKPHVEETGYAPDDGMIHFSGEIEATVGVNCQTRDDVFNPAVKPWPIYFSVALYPTGVGDQERAPEVYLTVEEV